MKIVKVATLGLFLFSAASMAECVNPQAPTLPAGESASMEDMLAGQKSVKTFQAANIEYMTCLEQVYTVAEAATKTGSSEDKATAQSTYTQAIDAYNAAVSNEETVAAQFNTSIRAYKSANPG